MDGVSIKVQDDESFPDLSGNSDEEIIEWMLEVAEKHRLPGIPPLWTAADMVFRYEGLSREIARLRAEVQDARNELSAFEAVGDLKGAPINILVAALGETLRTVIGRLKEAKTQIRDLGRELETEPGITMTVTICNDGGHIQAQKTMDTTADPDSLDGKVRTLHQEVHDSLSALNGNLERLYESERVEHVAYRGHTIHVLGPVSGGRYSWRVPAPSGEFAIGQHAYWWDRGGDRMFVHETGDAALAQAKEMLDSLFDRQVQSESAMGVKP